MPLIQGHAKSADAGDFYDYAIDGSLRFNDDDSAYLSRTPASAGNRKTWTWSGWVKRGNIDTDQFYFSTYDSSTDRSYFGFDSGNQIHYFDKVGNVTKTDKISTAVFRDVSAWYHIVLVVDTDNGISEDRVKIYVNNQRITAWNTDDDYPINTNTTVNTASVAVNIGRYGAGSQYFDGYLAEVNFIDGTALDPTDFGEFKSGVWIPKAYEGSYGTNGFYLPLTSDANDDSGNGNNWTENNLASTDYVLDSPTNNFCTMSPLMYRRGYNSIVLSEGNLRVYQPNSAVSFATFTMNSGKWYWEVFVENNGTVVNHDSRGIIEPNAGQYDGTGVTPRFVYNSYNGTYSINSGSFTSSDIGAANNPDIIGFAWDADNGYMTVSVNGVAGTTITGLTTGTPMCPFVGCDYNTIDIMNFGQDSSFAGNKTAQGNTDANGYGDFYYAPPSGYLALCTANLPDPVASIDPAQDGSPQDHFNTVLYTGNGGAQSITGVGFQPDFLWIKCRSAAQSHALMDVHRGITKTLYSNAAAGEDTYTMMTSFDSDGWSMNGSLDLFNGSSKTYVAWNWKADGSGVSNTDGSITSTVSANTEAGFSIVSWTVGSTDNQTVGHGLNNAPDLIITKNRDTAYGWATYHSPLGATKYLDLSETASAYTNVIAWNNTEPTSTVFTIGDASWYGASSDSMIAYCFHSVDGFSKFGSYTGNGSTDGPFVYTGFRPAFVMIKQTDATPSWYIWDSARDSYNVSVRELYPNLSNAEGVASATLDFLSNGFKFRTSSSGNNASGGTYIYMCFSENPFKYSNAR